MPKPYAGRLNGQIVVVDRDTPWEMYVRPHDTNFYVGRGFFINTTPERQAIVLVHEWAHKQGYITHGHDSKIWCFHIDVLTLLDATVPNYYYLLTDGVDCRAVIQNVL